MRVAALMRRPTCLADMLNALAAGSITASSGLIAKRASIVADPR